MTSPVGEPKWREGAGGLLLLVAAHETGLLSQLEEVLPMKQRSLCVPEPLPQPHFLPQRSLLLTLLFLPVVGLLTTVYNWLIDVSHNTWFLRNLADLKCDIVGS